MYFLSGENLQPRGRRFEVAGVYETGLEEFDNLYILGDIKHIRRLNSWKEDEVSGFEIFIDDFRDLDRITEELYEMVGYDLNVRNVREIYPQIFDWLKLLDKNVVVILVLMTAVSIITMISTLLILILERTNMIGILKALGMRDLFIRRIFFYNAAEIIFKGLFWGNIAGIIPAIIQHKFGILKLDQASYYLTEVPVNIDILTMLLINAGVFVICMAVLVIPSYVISRITPLKAIRFS
jgi:lipoprotein-releasing system permease protein